MHTLNSLYAHAAYNVRTFVLEIANNCILDFAMMHNVDLFILHSFFDLCACFRNFFHTKKDIRDILFVFIRRIRWFVLRMKYCKDATQV